MKRAHTGRAVGLLLILALLLPAAGQTQQPFEVALSGYSVGGCFFLAFPLPSSILWVNPDRVGFSDSDVIAIASAAGQPVFALLTGSTPKVATIQPDGSRAPFFNAPPGFGGSAIAVAPTGRVFLNVAAGLAVISPAGVHEATYPMPGRNSDSVIAAAPDGCTVYYAKLLSVGRINGCTGAVLADFSSLTTSVSDIHPLSNGQVLIASGSNVVLHDASGAAIRTIASLPDYDLPGHTADQIATTPDEQILWIAAMAGCDNGGYLLRVSMSDGRELSRVNTGNISIGTGLVVGNATAEAIPTASAFSLCVLAALLALGGAMLLRK